MKGENSNPLYQYNARQMFPMSSQVMDLSKKKGDNSNPLKIKNHN